MKNKPIPDKPYICPDADITILPMSRNDIDEILEIENVSFPGPWSMSIFEKELKNPFSFPFVARFDKTETKTIAGYIIVWLVAEEAHILNLAVHPDFRRKGIARLLLEFMLDFLAGRSARVVYLEVRRSNISAQRLYMGFGFSEIGVRKEYYSDNKEDAIVMGLEMACKSSAPKLL